MRLFPSDRHPLPLPEGHRFPASKYGRLRQRLEAHVATGANFQFIEPHAATDDELLRVHDRGYVGRVLSGALSPEEVRRIGFPWSPGLVERSLRSTGAAVDAAAAAIEDGVAAILDCDVHQGNGTAEIFTRDTSVFTMSIHGARNFPLRKFPSSLDVPLDDGTGDADYLEALARALTASFARSRPGLVLFIAGADPYEGDRLGRLALSKAGLLERDRMVMKAAGDAGVPIAIVCGGGYCEDIESIVDIHAATMLLAAKGSTAR